MPMSYRCASVVALAALACPALSSPALAQGQYDSDWEWATVGATGNAGYVDPVYGRSYGSVDYAYRIAKTEVSTGQWLDFVNAFGATQRDWALNFGRQPGWSFVFDPNNPSGIQYELVDYSPDVDEGNLPLVSGASFVQAMQYCNWLQSGKSTDFNAIHTGVYDVARFETDPNYTLADVIADRNPDADYWIPTEDEWVKAVYYDPNRFGEGQGGWWDNSYSSDEPPQPGLPGEAGAMTSAGVPFDFDEPNLFGQDVFLVELGAYEDNGAASPWGLLDTSGGGREILGTLHNVFDTDVMLRGNSTWTATTELDKIQSWDSLYAPAGSPAGVSFRLATTVPTPASATAFLVLIGICQRAHRRRTC